MAEQLDILDERDPIRFPALGSVLLHAGLVGVVFLYTFWVRQLEPNLGSEQVIGGAYTVSAVKNALDRLGKAYLEFARAQPAFYSAMFEAGVPVGADPALREASERAFAVLRGAADKLCAAMPAAARPPALMVALHIWAMAHGVASLFGRGDGAQRALPMSPAELLEANVLIYLRGLGVNAEQPSGPLVTRPSG